MAGRGLRAQAPGSAQLLGTSPWASRALGGREVVQASLAPHGRLCEGRHQSPHPIPQTSGGALWPKVAYWDTPAPSWWLVERLM